MMAMGMKALGKSKVDKLKSSMASLRSRMKTWIIRATTSIMLWTCIVQLITLGETWGPRLLKGWSCFSQESAALSGYQDLFLSVPPKIVLPPNRIYKNNGGLRQMRAAVSTA